MKRLTFTLVDHASGKEHTIETTELEFRHDPPQMAAWDDGGPHMLRASAPVLSFVTTAETALKLHDMLYPGPRTPPPVTGVTPAMRARIAFAALLLVMIAIVLLV